MRLHDARIGTHGAFHLFRMPHEIETRVHAHLAGAGALDMEPLLANPDAALACLARLAQGESKAGTGPVRFAGITRLTHRPSLRKAAACYAAAFRERVHAFPYFAAD